MTLASVALAKKGRKTSVCQTSECAGSSFVFEKTLLSRHVTNNVREKSSLTAVHAEMAAETSLFVKEDAENNQNGPKDGWKKDPEKTGVDKLRKMEMAKSKTHHGRGKRGKPGFAFGRSAPAHQQREKHAKSMVETKTMTSSCDQFLGEANQDFDNFMDTEIMQHSVSMAAGIVQTFALASGPGGAVAGASASFAFSMMSEKMFPDPNEKRIQMLQEGMSCLNAEVKKISAKVDLNTERIHTLYPLVSINLQEPILTMFKNIESKRKKHTRCISLMRCVADFKWLKEKHDYHGSEEQCEKVFEHDTGDRITDCDAKAFRNKLRNDYGFLSTSIHQESLFNALRTIIYGVDNNWYKTARELLSQYTSAIASVIMIWTMLGEWAQAICYAYGDWNSCDDNDREEIKNGFLQFENEVERFIGDVESFENKLNDEDFVKTRNLQACDNFDGKSTVGRANKPLRKTLNGTSDVFLPDSYYGWGFAVFGLRTLAQWEFQQHGLTIKGIVRERFPENLEPEYVLKRKCFSSPCHVTNMVAMGRVYWPCEHLLKYANNPRWSLHCSTRTANKVETMEYTCGFLQEGDCWHNPWGAAWTDWPPKDKKNFPEWEIKWEVRLDPLLPEVDGFKTASAVLKKMRFVDPPRKSEIEPTDQDDLSQTFRSAVAL